MKALFSNTALVAGSASATARIGHWQKHDPCHSGGILRVMKVWCAHGDAYSQGARRRLYRTGYGRLSIIDTLHGEFVEVNRSLTLDGLRIIGEKVNRKVPDRHQNTSPLDI